jgi:hypothetical protein
LTAQQRNGNKILARFLVWRRRAGNAHWGQRSQFLSAAPTLKGEAA